MEQRDEVRTVGGAVLPLTFDPDMGVIKDARGVMVATVAVNVAGVDHRALGAFLVTEPGEASAPAVAALAAVQAVAALAAVQMELAEARAVIFANVGTLEAYRCDEQSLNELLTAIHDASPETFEARDEGEELGPYLFRVFDPGPVLALDDVEDIVTSPDKSAEEKLAAIEALIAAEHEAEAAQSEPAVESEGDAAYQEPPPVVEKSPPARPEGDVAGLQEPPVSAGGASDGGANAGGPSPDRDVPGR